MGSEATIPHMTLDFIAQYSLYGLCDSMFPIVDRYILFEWLKIFGLVLGRCLDCS